MAANALVMPENYVRVRRIATPRPNRKRFRVARSRRRGSDFSASAPFFQLPPPRVSTSKFQFPAPFRYSSTRVRSSKFLAANKIRRLMARFTHNARHTLRVRCLLKRNKKTK
ncbi:hypothetical protein PUN28_010315 [Cardiocondyla obscurior]|uniref:Ribosomal protein L34 n=1 Tax=Cardiocondyla obscurior TaxID=286306 RepID=A0AAW2FQ53_9HYME